MKKIIMLSTVLIIGLLSSGCATWGAVKQDTNKAWNSTKEAVHNATK